MKTLVSVLVLLMASTLGSFAQSFGFTTSFPAGYVDARSKVVLKRNTFPSTKSVWYHTGSAWQQITVGPTSSDLTLTFTDAIYSGWAIHSRGTFSGLNLVGTTAPVTCPMNERLVQFALTSAAKDAGQYTNVYATQNQVIGTVTRGASGNSSFIHNMPDITISCAVIEGQETLVPGGGLQPDHDGDGIPDETDPDDDNDGISDGNDDFPKDATENNDQDNDGIGDNADPDDDNDGHPDGDDAFPFDPDQWKPDTDGDGTPDDTDLFPNNPREDKDSDGDGVGDNQDPNDNTPPGGPGQGDGDGDPGPGDGDGGTGPGGGGGGGDDPDPEDPEEPSGSAAEFTDGTNIIDDCRRLSATSRKRWKLR